MSEYRRIEISLRRQVAGGQWPVGAMLPSRRDLARHYSVSLVTLERAISPLLADGILRADDRRGTFVAELPPNLGAGNRVAAPPVPGHAIGSVGIVVSLAVPEGHEYQILHELEQVLSDKVRSLFVLNRANGPAGALGLSESIQAALCEDVEALVVICLYIDSAQIARELSQVTFGSTPTVCILAGELNLALPHVFYDNRSGGYQAARHLAERGWTDLTVVAPFTASWVTERIAGVQDAVSFAPPTASASPLRLQVLAGEGAEWKVESDPREIGYRTSQAAMASGWRPGGGIIGIKRRGRFGSAGRGRQKPAWKQGATLRSSALTTIHWPAIWA